MFFVCFVIKIYLTVVKIRSLLNIYKIRLKVILSFFDAFARHRLDFDMGFLGPNVTILPFS